MPDSSMTEADQITGTPHPRFAKHLYGQDKTSKKFLQSYNNQLLHHAWLIGGQKGVGKATLAWKIAKFLLELGLSSHSRKHDTLDIEIDRLLDARINALSEPALLLIRREFDPKKKRTQHVISVDNIRVMSESIGYAIPDNKLRIVVIDSIEELNENAANAFLKLLEEPPPRTYFFLISHSPHTVLPTIRSRCQIVHCDHLQPDDQINVLAQLQFKNSEHHSHAISLSNGSVGNAIAILNFGGIDLYQSIVNMFQHPQQIEHPQALALQAMAGNQKNKEEYTLLVYLIDQFLSRLVKVGVMGTLDSEIFPGELALLQKLSPSPFKATQWATEYSKFKFINDEYIKGNIDSYSHVFELFNDISRKAFV